MHDVTHFDPAMGASPILRFAADDLPSPANWHCLTAFYAGSSLLTSAPNFAAVATACRGDLVYLATPYSKLVLDEAGQFDEYLSITAADAASHWAARFAVNGITAVSPIVLADGLIGMDRHKLIDPLVAEFWTNWCRPLLDACAVVVVPPIAGWSESVGIWHEVRAQLARQRRVYLIAGG